MKNPLACVIPSIEGDGSIHTMEGRMRLCPYYFVDVAQDRAELHGILATLCPADKKIIHGMKDAALLPCVEAADPTIRH